jgi:parallel beta-helix repeat protein
MKRAGLILLALAGMGASMPASGESTATIRVRAGESIAGAIERADPGTTIEVEPGVYRESLTVDQPGITLRGLVEGERRPVLDGEGERNDAVIASGKAFAMSGFGVRSYRGNGVTTQGVRGVVLRDLEIESPGLYGVYPVETWELEVTACEIRGATDAGIYVGSSNRAKIHGNETTGNVVGIHIQNSNDVEVRENHVHGNTVGVLVSVAPLRLQKSTARVRVRSNRIEGNNLANFGDPNALVGRLPAGLGLLVLGADETLFENNAVHGNETLGVGVLRVPKEEAAKDPDIDPSPDRNRIGANELDGNGLRPHSSPLSASIPSGAAVWDGLGDGNCADASVDTQPVAMPRCAPR